MQFTSFRMACVMVLVACEVGGEVIELPPLPPRKDVSGRPVFVCESLASVGCESTTHLSCTEAGEFLQVKRVDCGKQAKVCDAERVCIVCPPGQKRCQPCDAKDETCDSNVAQRCDEDANGWTDIETCDLPGGDVCDVGSCVRLCDLAASNRSYVGCEFWAADLDNAAIDDLNNASAQQFAVGVANPQPVAVEVRVEINDAAFGEEPAPREIDVVMIAPGSLEVFELPRREVDGASEEGLNDGTHTAVTSQAFRVSSTHPITAYQFNPLENVNVFSNDASLLLPTSALGNRYTVVGWPQTIGHSDDPELDFDSTSDKDNLRAFLTIIGTSEATQLEILLGGLVQSVVGASPIPASLPGDRISIEIGPYDVVNLETEGLNSDFTGTVIESSQPVTVFVGSEASDVPMFGTYATRQCCADHLEEQLFPDATVGNFYIIGRMPSRTQALSEAGYEDDPLHIAVVDEPEWVRVLAVASGNTTLETTLPMPNHRVHLQEGQDITLRADQDFMIQSDKPVAVLQAMASQGVTGIPREYPGGDPSIIAVAPSQQYRRDYVFLTPDKYAFDFVVITAEATTHVLLDGEPLPDTCTTSPADGLEHQADDPEPDWVIHRCQLSFPKVTSGANSRVVDADQNDGVHTLVAERPVGIVVWGFDRFVSYAYVAGLNLDIIN